MTRLVDAHEREFIRTALDRNMVVEAAASHSVYISQPEAVAAIIETAVKGVG